MVGHGDLPLSSPLSLHTRHPVGERVFVQQTKEQPEKHSFSFLTCFPRTDRTRTTPHPQSRGRDTVPPRPGLPPDHTVCKYCHAECTNQPWGPDSRKDAEAEPSPRPGQLQRLRPAGPGSAPLHRSAVPQYLSHQKHPLNPRCLTQTPPPPPAHACGAKHDPHPNAGPPGRRDPSAGLRGDPCAGWHVSVGH